MRQLSKSTNVVMTATPRGGRSTRTNTDPFVLSAHFFVILHKKWKKKKPASLSEVSKYVCVKDSPLDWLFVEKCSVAIMYDNYQGLHTYIFFENKSLMH